MRIRLSALSSEEFHDMCGELLYAEYSGFHAFDGRGGDEKIDGFDDDTRTTFQFHHPSGAVAKRKLEDDIEGASRHPIRRWVFVTSKNLTIRTARWIRELQSSGRFNFTIEIWGPNELLRLLDKHKSIRDRLFPPPTTYEDKRTIHVEQQNAEQIINVAGSPVFKFPRKSPKKVFVTNVPDAISDAQLLEIKEQAARIAEASGGKTSVGFILKRIKQEWSLDALRNLSRQNYPAVLEYLRRFKYAKFRSQSPAVERARLIRQLHATASNIGWSHEQLSQACKTWYGRSIANLSIHLLHDAVARLKKKEEESLPHVGTPESDRQTP
jgi:hypothetical protein